MEDSVLHKLILYKEWRMSRGVLDNRILCNLDLKNPPPPPEGRFPFWMVSKRKAWRKRIGPLRPGSSFETPQKKKSPGGGGFLRLT